MKFNRESSWKVVWNKNALASNITKLPKVMEKAHWNWKAIPRQSKQILLEFIIEVNPQYVGYYARAITSYEINLPALKYVLIMQLCCSAWIVLSITMWLVVQTLAMHSIHCRCSHQCVALKPLFKTSYNCYSSTYLWNVRCWLRHFCIYK